MNKSVRDTSNKKGLSGRGLVALVLLLSAFLSACQTASLPFPWPGGAARAPAGQPPEAQRDAKRDVVPASRSPSSSRRAPSQPEQLPLGEPVETAAPSRPSPAAPSAPLSAPPPSPPLTAPDRQTADAEPGWPPTFDDMPARSQRPPGDIALVEPSRESPAPPSFTPLLNRPVPPQTAPQGAQPEVVPAMPPPPPMKTSSVRVALLLPLSGPNAQIGEAMLNAAQLALFSFSDKSFELLVHDTKGTPEGAADAARFAIADGARLILGPLLSASVKAVTPAARAANVPVVAFSSDKSVAGDGAFTMGFIPSAEVWRVVRFARSRGVQRFAALAPDTPYGRTVIEDFRQAVERNGAVATRVEFYDPHTEDYTALVREFADYDSRRAALLAQRAELKARDDEVSKRALDRLERLQTLGPLPFDALFLADGGKRLQAIAALLPFYDIDPAKVRMLGTGQWDEPGIGREPALVGGWYAAPPPDSRANFEAQYRQTYGELPPRLATLAYDATALATVLARGTNEGGDAAETGIPGGPDFSFKALTTPSGFAGRDGIFRLLPDGLPERGLSVLQVGPRENKVISPAPDSFSQQAAK